MKSLLIFCCLILASSASSFAESNFSTKTVAEAIATKANKVQVQGRGVVKKILRDDTYGSKHQRFILQTPEGSSLLIVYNIDIAERITNLKVGDSIEYAGEFIWNDKGGLVHWTHHDPRGHHPGGWIKHKGKTYQ